MKSSCVCQTLKGSTLEQNVILAEYEPENILTTLESMTCGKSSHRRVLHRTEPHYFFLTNFSIKFILGQFGENELEKNYSTVVDTYVHSHTCVSEVVDS